MKRIFLLIILATSCFFLARGTDYYVDATTGSNTTGDGSSGNPWQTITYALSQITGTGHTLYVAAGTYNPTLGETFPILMKNGVSLVGAGIDISIIDANSTNTVIRCVGIVDSSTRIEGFTINQGKTSGDNNGGGISINAGSNLLITNNLITENEGGDYSGGGVYISNSCPRIENNTISNNIGKYVQKSGSAIYVTGSSSASLITGNTISGNNNSSGGGGAGGGTIVLDGSSETVLQGNIILNNNTSDLGSYLGVITVYDCSPTIRSNVIAKSNLNGIKLTNTSSSPSPTIINNTISDHSEDGIYIGVASPDSIFNNIISLNSGYGIRETGSTSDPGKVWYNLFFNNGLGLYIDESTTDYYTANLLNSGVPECKNNNDGDPMFVDRINGDFKLLQISPAIDAGDPDPKFNDPDGSRNDIGALPYDYPPAAPQNLSATGSAGEITLRWNPNTDYDLDQYNIYRDLISPAITLIDSVISTSPPDTFYIDIGLIIGQDYYYRITALDIARNESDFSDEVNTAIPFDLYTDSLALVALYDSTNGAGWTNHSNWLLGNVSTWYGVTVSGDRITSIFLSNNNLDGIIPPSIGDFDSLNSLSLSENQITGSIPTEIGDLINLTMLNLANNSLSGNIPTTIGSLTSLQVLYLDNNLLTGSIPAEISSLPNLDGLILFNNQLSGSIPTEIGNLTSLQTLSLSQNQLTGSIPTEIGNLTNLTDLHLYNNQLSGSIPNEISNLTSLQYIYLNNNQFTDLPDLSSLSSLLYLEIENNQFTFKDIEPNIGVASTTFTYSPQDSVGEIIDTTVYIGTNFTLSVSTGGNSSLYQWKKDEVNIGTVSGDSTYTINPVAFSDSGTYTCEITNTVATDLTLYSRPVNVSVVYPPIYQDSLALVALYDSTDGANWTNNTNWLTGNVSTWFGITVSSNRVTEISFDQNNFYGTIPPEIGNLTNLTLLTLEENQLTGSIPTEIGNLTKLTTLRFYNSQLSGSIPSEIGNLTNLTFLDFNSCQLTGSIPAEIGILINLNFLDLSNNQLSGSIPTEIGNLTSLQNLQLWDNQLTGSIPATIGNLLNLEALVFDRNQLSGSIPSTIGNLTKLVRLHFGNNQLTGSIPDEIGNLTDLNMLELVSNQLTGSIPVNVGNLTNLTLIIIANNQFTDLPDLSTLDSLDDLSIENNQFTFKDIEPNIGVASTTYTYSPQDSVGEIIDKTVYVGTNFTLSVSTGGANSQYQWKKDGTNIGTVSGDSTYTLNPVAFSDSGAYTCEITNTVATDLTLYSRPVNILVDYSPLQKDSLALVALYDSTDGANWTNNTNWLAGPVSTWYGISVSGDRVTEIILGDNNLAGTIPPEIGNLNLWGQLVLCNNQLSGSIPTEIGNLTNLVHLDIENNQLTGEIPPEIGNLTNLQGLYLYGNQLIDSIPAEIGNLINLNGLHLGSNQLTGSIPIQIGNLINLTYLSFGGNNLTGSIPTEIGNLTNLNTLYLSDNHQLSGLIPSEIGNLTNLQQINLSFNQLTGEVPNTFTGLTKLEKLELNHNLLSDLPDLSPLALLYELAINNNQFTFKDIEPNIGVASTTYAYSPQDSVGEIIDTTIYVGTSYTMSVSTGGANSQYQWKKDGINIGTVSSDSTYTINPVALSDSGTYTCEITNTVATDLTLYSRPVYVSVPSVLSSENDILTYSFPEQTGAATIDAVNHSVDIEAVYGTNLANLVATFSISSQASIAINSVDQISGSTANNFTNPVTYTVTAEDGSTQDWIITVSEAGVLTISDFPYSEDFESDNGGWRTGGANSSWEHGTPSAGQTINSAASGTNAWVTNLTGDYNPDEVSYVTSPQFDLSALNFPKIEFSIWWYAEGFYDGANLQYKLGSDAWKILGKEESDHSWYNSSYLYSIENGFGFDMDKSAGWSGDDEWGYGSNGWVIVYHALTGFDYQSANVTFRIGFASNSGYENDGIAIDDINIYDDPTGIDRVETGLSDIQIYPNPNEGTFTLVYNGEREVDLNLQLINLQGQVILSEQIETGNRFRKEFELDYLPPGLYYFRLMHKEGVVVKKMVVR